MVNLKKNKIKKVKKIYKCFKIPKVSLRKMLKVFFKV